MNIRNLSNSLWNILDVLLYPALYLLFTPFFIRHLGAELYGIWILVNTVIVLMQVFNVGLGTGTLRNVALCIGRGDRQGIHEVIRSNVTITLCLSCLCIIAGILLALATRYYALFHITPVYLPVTVRAIALTGLMISVRFLEQIQVNVLNAFEKIALVARYNTIVRLSNLFISMGLIASGYSIFCVVLSTLCIYLVALLVLYRFVVQVTGPIAFKLQWNRELIRKELRFNSWVWLQSIMVIAVFQCDKFLVAYWVGVAHFSYYSIVSTMFNHIHMALAAVTPWAMPQLSKRFARGENIRPYYQSVRSLVACVTYAGILIFYLVYRPVFRLWLGEDMLGHISLYLRLFLVFELFFAFTIVPYFLLNAIRRERLQTLNTFIYTSFALVGMLVGYYATKEVSGMLGGLICAVFLAVLVQQVLITVNVFHMPPWQESIGLLLPMVLLSLFLLSEPMSLLWRLSFLGSSMITFIYYYLYRYPFHRREWNTTEN